MRLDRRVRVYIQKVSVASRRIGNAVGHIAGSCPTFRLQAMLHCLLDESLAEGLINAEKHTEGGLGGEGLENGTRAPAGVVLKLELFVLGYIS